MKPVELDAFKYEIRNWNNIPLGSQNCGVNCIFCKINRDPILKRFPKIPAITLEDLYMGFKEIDPNYPFVRLGAGVIVSPHTDPFIHPDIYSFIKHTADYFPNQTVSTVTTASYLDLDRIDELNQISNFGIDLSLITMQTSRETLIPYSTREKLNFILKEAPIRKISLMFTGDIESLYRDLELLFSLELNKKCKEILVRRIEYTAMSPAILKKIAGESIAGYDQMVEKLKKDYPEIIYTVPYLESIFYKEGYHYFTVAEKKADRIRKEITARSNSTCYVMAPESTYDYLSDKLSNLSNALVLKVPNITYGGSITVAGLLTNHDLYAVLDAIHPEGGIILVSIDMYDRDQQDITGVPAADIEKRYNSQLLIL